MSTATNRKKPRTGMIAIAFVLTLVLSSCSFTSTKDYRIEWGALRSRLNLHEVTVDNLEAYRGLSYADNIDAMRYTMKAVVGFSYVCLSSWSYRESIRCVMGMVRKYIDLDGRTQSFWLDWHDTNDSDKVKDYEDAYKSAVHGDYRCLVSDFANVAPGNNNWTYRTIGESECRRGG